MTFAHARLSVRIPALRLFAGLLPVLCLAAAGRASPVVLEPVLESARTSLRSRLLRRLVGDSYAVLVITPKGRSVRSVEIHELPPDAA